jgi:class 3 adenylate cyclase/tetratricopeptide (TPR) repeat protein
MPDYEVVEGERKTVTALFADIKGSMELMEDLDPEEARAIVDPALKLMIDAAHRYDGYIVQSTGDGIFALFGAPVAHEDHPQRALYAALRMQEELRRYSDRLREAGNLAVEARVGVNTGEVVVRSIRTDDTHTEYTPIGHSTSLAARMQALAPTGSIAATEHTRRLCEGYFSFKLLGPTRVKGVSEAVNVVEVTGLGPLRTRLQVATQRGLTKFVGRQAELEQMKHALGLAREGRGQIVAAMGEPGVGKSRLFLEFKEVAEAGCLVLEAYSVSHGRSWAYLPVIDLLRSYFDISDDDDERKRREKVTGKLLALERSLEDTLPYIFPLLDIGQEGDGAPAQLDPQLRRRRTLVAIKRILIRESLSQPLIVIFEDLHWIDSETQALLNMIVDGLATVRILLAVNYRPEYHHQWGNKTYYTQLRLDPLGRESADEMLAALLALPAPGDASAGANAERARPEAPLAEGSLVRMSRSPERSKGETQEERVRVPDGIKALQRVIVERTEGNPFFMEEMVQALFEQGVLLRNGGVKLAKQLDEVRIPATVQAILASRIDRLAAPEKELLQILAVLGREFPLALVQRVAGRADDELEQMLSVLQLAEFIYEQPTMDDREYTFKHTLTQEVAYGSMLAGRRRSLHALAAQAIEVVYADGLDDYLSELSHHYDYSGDAYKAVEYLGRAGQRAVRQVAHSDAIGYVSRAIELLKELPEGLERDRRELELQMALASSLLLVRGPGAEESGPVLARAQALSERFGDDRRLMEVLLDQSLFLIYRHQHQLAAEMAERVRTLAERGAAPAMIAGAHLQLGVALCFMGQFKASREHLEHAPGFVSFGAINASGSELLPDVLFMLGYPAAALARSTEFLTAARRISDPFAIVDALNTDARIHMFVRDTQAVMTRVTEIVSIATEYEIGYLIPFAAFLRGWALANEGRCEEAIPDIKRAIVEAKSAMAAGSPWMLAILAKAYGKSGQPQEGLEIVSTALASIEQTSERIYEAEIHRTKGELLLMRNPGEHAAAQGCFGRALDVSRRQNAKSLELRAAMSLARVLDQRGERHEARRILADIYGWFTEGFETADLKDARALLDELSD